MAHITFIQRDGAVVHAQGSPGQSLMQVAVEHSVVGIDAVCGGFASCGTCHVHVDAPWLQAVGAVGNDEKLLLQEVADVRDDSRLACQIQVSEALDGLKVTVAGR